MNVDKESIRIKVEEARQALKEAAEKDDREAIFFWSGYLLALT